MKILRNLFLSLAALSAASFANAIEFTDVDVDGHDDEWTPGYIKLSSSGRTTWRNTFNIVDAGFNSSTMRIVSAIVSFAFADDEYDVYEKFDIVVGGSTLWSRLEVDGTYDNSPTSYDWYHTSLSTGLIEDLQIDGVLNYSVKAIEGDSWFKEARIVAQVEHIGVPDTGTTGALLGVTFVGLIAFARKFRRA